ncbi:multicopper polyphenol oxidase [Actinotalea ferrariae CF5-4]|uniref:Purine nucleoside phosphorylase n=1 Tax=Actinotalea ferrariae CF5-4 TaxID=948458 RepID=A0A021VUJ4_9CELL|nr:peptidoglycan editing factor PgeF [Actinotalea ferrariae]EYR64803.1 multicopper polyphenol oxidase [Actinotalea ferrariae CF5-4]
MSAADALPVVPVDLGRGVRAVLTTTATGNLGTAVGDDPANVARVRARVDRVLGAPVLYAQQVHGAHVHVVEAAVASGHPVPGGPHGAAAGADPLGPGVVAVADALVTNRTDVALGVVVADCVPVLLADVDGGVVGVAHAGRRGLVDGIVPAVVAVLLERGADVSRLRAVVGPAACGRCYEVPAELRDEVASVLPSTASTTSWGTPALDLPAGVAEQLREAGLEHVERQGGCTVEERTWFSHRVATGGSRPPGAPPRQVGRMAGVVRLL